MTEDLPRNFSVAVFAPFLITQIVEEQDSHTIPYHIWMRRHLTQPRRGITTCRRIRSRRPDHSMWHILRQANYIFAPPNRPIDRSAHSKHAIAAQSPRMMHDYQRVGSLNAGGMSIAINIVKKRSTGKLYVEKQVAKVDEYGPSRARKEIEALRQISGEGWKYHLNTMLECAVGRDAHHIILEYCDGGNLKDAIDRTRDQGGRYSEAFIWHVLVSGMIALKFLHGGPVDYAGRQGENWNTICHLDIKPENIYLQDTGAGFPRVVLGDFGGAVSNSDIRRGRASLNSAPAWTPGWEAPEMVARREYGTKTDAWQLGCVAQTMCLLKTSPDQRLLGSALPCGGKYSQDLNMVVYCLTRTSIHRRWNAEDMLGAATRCLRGAIAMGV